MRTADRNKQVKNVRRVNIISALLQAIPGGSPPNSNTKLVKRKAQAFVRKSRADNAIGKKR